MLNEYAWLMLTVQPESLRDPGTALDAATRACEREGASRGIDLWQYLDTLALAQYRNGDPVTAATTQREAIRILPAAHERYHTEMQQRLAEYHGAPTGGG